MIIRANENIEFHCFSDSEHNRRRVQNGSPPNFLTFFVKKCKKNLQVKKK